MAVSRRRKKRIRMIKFIRAFLITLVLISVIAVAALYALKHFQQKEAVKEEKERPPVITVDNCDITGHPREALREELLKRHPWSLSVIGDYDSYEFPDMYSEKLDKVLDKAYSSGKDSSFSTEYSDDEIDALAKKLAEQAAGELSVSVSHNDVIRYVAETDSFEFFDAPADRIIDNDALEEDIKAALKAGDYTARIQAKTKGGEIAFKAEDFKQIGYYQTHTTNNNDRNTNVRLSCEAVNGTILQPGERFSYNEKLGKRTAEKGYKEAGAYANGEHVMELGGGVCQLSSSMYNAVISANLQVDERTGHTYEPTYVTPGEDATVSYSKPDFAFTNSTEAPIGILTHYEDRTVTVKIFGLPQLEEGVTRHLRSEKIGVIDPPMPNYVEDPMVVPGYEDIVKNAKPGSRWKTYIVLEKDGEVISEEYLHTTTYKGEPATIRRNLAGLVALGIVPPTEGEQGAPADGN